VQALKQIEEWGADNAAAGVVNRERVVAWHGDEGHEFRWASVTKPVAALAVMVAVEEGVVDLDEAAGPPGSTVRHLLAHASGLPFDGTARSRSRASGGSTRTPGSRSWPSTWRAAPRCRSSNT
jgi:CubicO group peptidase (beta-lactamase class C family)